ncbi:sigma-70 family RNA polymerase sigma factor [Gryllotalpicola reticulitermitis]|uniref:Sigma-70 family RNA polymerase sigma factor n=1 Tax=Gryllotalpicola reticulitermitis TaxID=1184153 RepID=A0ABV8Q9Y5_9MICO
MRHAGGGEELSELVGRGQAGDTDAVDELVRRLRTRIFAYVLARIGKREEAEDVTQETCLALTSALPDFDAKSGKFTSFVFGIASNKVLMSQRSRGRRPEVPVAEVPEESSVAPGPAERYEHDDSLRRLLAQLDELPERHRDVLLLRVVAGLSADETAAALGTTAANVRVIQHRALSSLRARLGNGAENEDETTENS